MNKKEINLKRGRVTLPSEENFLSETKEMLTRLKADALRDSDGTKLPEDVKDLDAAIYTTYFVAREHNEFAKTVPEERQQTYLTSDFVMAESDTLSIDLMKHYYEEQLAPALQCDPKKYWEVMDRTTGEVVPLSQWKVEEDGRTVTLSGVVPYHLYSVSFLADMIWDTTSMYNHITNNWGDREHQLTINAMMPKSGVYMEEELERWLKKNPKTDIVRFTTFFYHFTLMFNDEGKEKFVDWFGYSASASAAAMDLFEKEKGYRLRPEAIVDEGYFNNPFRIPSKEFLDYVDFMQKFVSQKAKRLVDLVHKAGKKAVMFLGDTWMGTEPYGPYFKDIGLDGVVGSVGDGTTLRIISDISHLDFTEGRFLPYFFPDVFHEGGDPVSEGRRNWIAARRAILRKPVDRIGYGGYLSLAYKFPEFIDYMEQETEEYREIMKRIEGKKPYAKAKVAILNWWGKLRSWMPYTVAHGIWYQRSYSYIGILEALSGMDVDVSFLSFDEVKEKGIDPDIDVLINAGDAGTSWSGGYAFVDPEIVSKLREFVYQGGGLIGIGEPSAYAHEGRYFQLADLFGVDREMGFSQSSDKYFWTEVSEHFIWGERNAYHKPEGLNFGEPVTGIYALDENTQVLCVEDGNVKMAAREVGSGRTCYFAGLPYTQLNTFLLKQAILYVAHKEDERKRYESVHPDTEVAAYPQAHAFAVYNNSQHEVHTTVLDGKGHPHEADLAPAGLVWFEEEEDG